MSTVLHRARFRRDHRWTPGHMSAYVEGDLSHRARHRLQRHIQECPECRRILLGLQRMLDRMRAAPRMAAAEETPDITSAVRRRLHERRQE
jgi:anti-sigma factor RsiW